jgi:hypothetical protein
VRSARAFPFFSTAYRNPTIASAAIKVGASDHAVLYTIVTPVGPYFAPAGGVAPQAGK